MLSSEKEESSAKSICRDTVRKVKKLPKHLTKSAGCGKLIEEVYLPCIRSIFIEIQMDRTGQMERYIRTTERNSMNLPAHERVEHEYI